MKSLQSKYNILHILYWISYLSIYGYIAIFLQYRGLSNTEIGIVSGAGALLSIFISPFISSLVTRIQGLNIKKTMLILYILMFIAFLLLTYIPLPISLIMILYIFLLCVMVSNVPFLSMICMDYLKEGHYLNFGVARGLGSIAYASGAVIVSQFITWINPTVIIYVYLISSCLLFWILFSMPDSQTNNDNQEENKTSAFTIMKEYKVFFFVLIGIAFMFSASTALSTYLINIVTHLGGSTSLYGIAIFFMAASEMPVMAKTYSLMKKFSAETLLLAAAFFYIIRNFTICLAPNIPILMIGMMFQGISFGLFTATIAYYVNDHLKSEHQMMGQTMIGMMSTGLGSTLGNVLGGFLQDNYSIQAMFIFACAMTLIGFLIIFFTLRKKVSLKKHKSYL